MLRKGLERKHGVGFLDALDRPHAIGDQFGNIIVGFSAHNGNQVINPSDRVNFRNLRDAREFFCDLGYFIALDV